MCSDPSHLVGRGCGWARAPVGDRRPHHPDVRGCRACGPRGLPRHQTLKTRWRQRSGAGEGVVGTHAGGRLRAAAQGGRRVTSGDATSHAERAMWRLWFPARQGGDPSVPGGPPRQALPNYLQPGPRAGA